MPENHRSEIAYFREQVEREEQAAQLGLYGFAITARMERGGQHILSLIQEGRHDEAFRLMNCENWGIEEMATPGKDDGQAAREGMQQDESATGAK